MLHDFRMLRSPRQASRDLALLDRLAPTHPRLGTYRRNPRRHADDILHALLQVAGREEIERWREDGSNGQDGHGVNGLNGLNGLNGVNGVNGVNGLNGVNGQPRPSSPLTPLIPSSPLQKEQEYPHIPWRDLANPDVQTATILYNDRVNSYREMQAIEDRIDQAPTPQDIAALAEMRIRNLQAFDELEALDSGKPLPCRHPLLAHRSLRAQLEALLKADPAEFLRRHRNALDNIRRYRRYVKDPKRKSRRKQDQALLEKHKENAAIFQELLKERKAGGNAMNAQDAEGMP